MSSAPEPPSARVVESLAAQLEALVMKRLQGGDLGLPTTASSIDRCLALLNKPDLNFSQLVPALEADAMLTARVLRLANSVAAARASQGITLSAAVTRVGMKRLRTLVVEASAERLFLSRDARIAEAVRAVWHHSVAVSFIARDLCALSGRADAEEAAIVGLLHDLGRPVVASFLLEAERQISEVRGRAWVDSEVWRAVLRRTAKPVGAAIAAKWGLPDAVQAAMRDLSDYDAANRSGLVNIIVFANAAAEAAGLGVDEAEKEEAPTLLVIGRSLLGLEESLVESVVASAKGRLLASG